MSIQAGSYRAKVTGECVLGESKGKHTPFIEFYLTILDGENKGGMVRWTGYFAEKTNERTIQSLQVCGWKGEDLSEFSDSQLHGLDANEVSIVVELEKYTADSGEERSAPRVAWINRAGGFVNKSAAMAPDAAKSFGDRMRALVLQSKAKQPAAALNGKDTPAAEAPSDDGVPF